MRYVEAEFEEYMSREAYRSFVSKTLRLINNGVVQICGGSEMKFDYTDYISEKETSKKPIKKKKTSCEIIDNVENVIKNLK